MDSCLFASLTYLIISLATVLFSVYVKFQLVGVDAHNVTSELYVLQTGSRTEALNC